MRPLIIAIVLAASSIIARAQGVPPAGSHDQTLTGNNSLASPLGVRVATGGGLDTGGGVGGLKLGPCTVVGQVWQWTGTTWACADNASQIAGTLNTILMATPDGSHAGNSLITQSGTTDTVGGTLGVNTSGQTQTISTFHGANSDGLNVWIGGGGLNSVGSGGNTTLGAYNVSLGPSALLANTTGNKSVGIGYQALLANTTGSDLVAIGHQALLTNTTGNGSVGIGYQSLRANTSGSELVGIGTQALFANTSGSQIVGIGYTALAGNTTGNNLVGVGAEAAIANTTGNSSVGVGSLSLHSNTTGSNLVGVGYQALYDLNITANDGSGSNTAVGANTGRGIVTGTNNTIIGANVTGLSSSLSGQIIIADGAGNQRIKVNSSAQATLAGTLQIMGTGATWTSGTGVPAISCAKGDEFSRTDGGVGTTLYVCTATNTWTALSSTTGTITGVTAGLDLTGGGSSGSVTLAVDETLAQHRVGGTCTGPNAIRAIAQDGTVTCTTGVSTLTNSAGSNVIPKSDGTNLVASSLSDNATIVSTTEAVSVGTATGVGKFSALSGNSGAAGGTAIANALWDTNYSLFGPNVGSGTGSALALAYSTTDDTAKVISAKPGNAWKGLDLLGSQLRVYINGSVQATLSSTTFAMTGAGTFSTTLGVTGLSTLTGGFTLGADSSANTHKITSLTNGSSAQDAVAFNQLATAVNAAVSGTSGRSSRFTGTNAIGNGAFTDDGTNATIGGTLGVTGSFSAGSSVINGNLQVIGGRIGYPDALLDQGTLFTVASGSTIQNIKGATSGTFTPSGTTETVTFGITFPTTPTCTISTDGTVKGYSYTRSTTQIVFSSLTAGQKYDFNCNAH